MNLRTLFFLCLLGLFSPLFAANQHLHATPEGVSAPATAVPGVAKKLASPGSCEIEIINHSYDDVRVFGVYNDGVSLEPFNVYSYESPRYIPLYYNGYCHDGMDLYIDSFNGAHLYSGYVRRYTTIRIVNWLFGENKIKVSVQSK